MRQKGKDATRRGGMKLMWAIEAQSYLQNLRHMVDMSQCYPNQGPMKLGVLFPQPRQPHLGLAAKRTTPLAPWPTQQPEKTLGQSQG